MDLKNLTHQLISFEKETDVLNQTINGIHFWQLIRFDLYQHLSLEKNLFAFAHPNLRTQKGKFGIIIDLIKSAIARPPLFFRKHKIAFILFPHTRTIGGRDIYSSAIYDLIKDHPHRVIYPRLGASMPQNSLTMGLADGLFTFFNVIFNKTGWLPLHLLPQDRNTITTLESRFKKFFDSDIALSSMIKREIMKFVIYKKIYTHLLKQTSPDYVITVTAYSFMPLIAAARDLNIRTYEIQHGTISTNHMGYYYPHCDAPPYMPDTLLTHGQFWKRKPPLPKSLKTKTIGAAHITTLGLDHAKIKNQVLFFSQGTVAKDLFSFAQTVAENAPDYKIIYRLHPSEVADDYMSPNLPNFEIRHGGDGFFDDLMRSEFIATVYSTTIYEAMACGAKAIVIGLSGHNAVQDIIDNGDAQLAMTPDDFVHALSAATPCQDPQKYYMPFDQSKVKEIFTKSA
jgi:hypothetical protein